MLGDIHSVGILRSVGRGIYIYCGVFVPLRRNELLKQKKQQDEATREVQLRELAAKARAERAAILKEEAAGAKEDDDGSRAKRQAAERERRRDIEREMRLEVARVGHTEGRRRMRGQSVVVKFMSMCVFPVRVCEYGGSMLACLSVCIYVVCLLPMPAVHL